MSRVGNTPALRSGKASDRIAARMRESACAEKAPIMPTDLGTALTARTAGSWSVGGASPSVAESRKAFCSAKLLLNRPARPPICLISETFSMRRPVFPSLCTVSKMTRLISLSQVRRAQSQSKNIQVQAHPDRIASHEKVVVVVRVVEHVRRVRADLSRQPAVHNGRFPTGHLLDAHLHLLDAENVKAHDAVPLL